jgi:hypothetical protein
MHHVAGPYPAGTVIVPTSGTARYMEFYQCLERVEVPAGTRLTWGKSSDLAKQLNLACADLHGEWVWFLGDDHTFRPDTLLRLLAHGLPAVVPLNIQRVPPFGPVILKGATRPESTVLSWTEVPVGDGLWYLPAQHYTGTAGLLVRRDVFARIPKPAFRIGQYAPDRLNEDYWLFDQLAQLGVPTVVDLGTRLGHCNSFSAEPTVKDGQWWVTFAQDRKLAFAAPGS